MNMKRENDSITLNVKIPLPVFTPVQELKNTFTRNELLDKLKLHNISTDGTKSDLCLKLLKKNQEFYL